MAKSVLEAGWGMLKTQLQYKRQQVGSCVAIADEKYTSRACSSCGALTGPAGVNGLGVRQWVCRACGDTRDRDANAARTSWPRGGVPRPFSGTSPRISLRRRAGRLARARHGPRRLVRRHEHRIFASVEITDPAAYEDYRRRVPAIIAAYGGRYLARGGAVERLEGDAPLNRLVILEFSDIAQLKAFYNSAEYQPLLAIRKRAARSSLLAIEGV
jgi:uncharacterized protein (DUF1330 family)